MFALDGTITVRLRLPPSRVVAPPAGVAIREVARDDVQTVFAGSPLTPGSLSELDTIAPLRWRCFAAFEDGRPVHHSFVAYCSTGPELFRVLSAPSCRGRGIFVAVVSAIAQILSHERESVLTSKIGVRNASSLHAHRAAGFAVVHRRYAPILLGWNVRLAASHAWRRTRGRPLR